MAEEKLRIGIQLEVDNKDKNLIKKELDAFKKELEKKMKITMSTENKKQLDTEKEISKAKERTAIASQKQYDLNKKISSDQTKKAIQEKESLKREEQKLEIMKRQAQVKINDISTNKYSKYADMGQVSSITSQIGGLSVGDDGIQKMKLLNQELAEVSSNAKRASVGANTFADDMKHSFKKFSEYMIIGTLIMSVTNSIKSGISSIFELDKALTELKKVVNLTGNDLKNFIADSYELADALGATNIQVIEAVTIFSKMGYAVDQSTKLGALAVKLQTVGDGMGTIEDTANSLVAVLKGFGVDENSAVAEVTKRVDQLNAVSNEMAVSTGDITAGMERASAALAVSGNNFEESTALIVAGTEVLRDSTMVARGLVTSSQRIFDQGADALKKYGIETTNANGTIRSTFDILTDLHEIYPTLTEEQQRWTLTQISGKDQFKTLASIMQNWNSVAKTMQIQMNANGSATDELNRKLESLEGRVNKMTNSFTRFWNTAIDSSLVKGIISLITDLTDSFTTLNVATQGVLLPTVAFLAVLYKFQKVEIVKTLLTWVAGLIGFSTAEGTATIATIGLTTSLRALQLAIPVIGLIMVALGVAVNKYQEVTQKATEETEKFKTAQIALNEELSKGDDTTRERVNNIQALSNEYDSLIEKQKQLKKEEQEKEKNSGSKTHERYRRESDELKEVNKQITEAKNKFKELGITVEEANSKIEQGREALAKTASQSRITTETMEHLSERLTDSASAYGMLKDAQSELDEQGYLSQATIDAINEKYGDFIDVTKLSSGAIVDFVNTEKKAITQSIQNNIAETNAQIKTRQAKIEDIKTEIIALGLLAKAKGEAGVVAMYDQYAKSRSLEGILKEVSALQNKTAVLKNSLSEIASIEAGKDKDKKSDKDKNKIELLSDLERQLLANANAISIQKEKTSQLNDEDAKKLDSLKSEIKLYEQRQQLVHLQANATRAEIASIKAKKSLTDEDKKKIEELQSDLYSYGQEWWSLTGNIKSANTAISDFGKKAQEAIDKQTKANLEFTKDQLEDMIKLLEDDLKSALESTENAIKKEAKTSEDAYNARIQAIKDTVESEQTSNEILEEQATLKEKLLALDKLKEQRANILSQKNVRFLVGNEFQFIADPLALKENSDAMATAEKDLADTKLDIKQKEHKREQDAEIKSLETQRDKAQSVFNQRLEDFKTYSDSVLNELKSNNSLTSIEQDALYATLKSKDEAYFTGKLAYVQEMASKIRADLASIGQIDVALDKMETSSGSVKPTSLIAPTSSISKPSGILSGIPSVLGQSLSNVSKTITNKMSSSSSVSIGNLNLTTKDAGSFVRDLQRIVATSN